MKRLLREQAIQLRMQKRLGYAAIAKIIPVSKSTAGKWLKSYPLNDRRIKELRQQNLKNNKLKIDKARTEAQQEKDRKFAAIYGKYIKAFSKLSVQSKYVAGLMLYLAEGSKRDPSHLALANTDARVINFFIDWLSSFLSISKKNLKFELHLYENMNIIQEVDYWKKALNIEENQFYKHQIRKLRKSSFSYKESFRHGTCSVKYSSIDKKREIMAAIRAFVDSFLNMRV